METTIAEKGLSCPWLFGVVSCRAIIFHQIFRAYRDNINLEIPVVPDQ